MSVAPIVRQAALVLSTARDNIDRQLLRIKEYLESTGLGYRGSLVDKDGYPLPDIDHQRILTERGHAARLLNDRKRVEYILDQLTQTQFSVSGDVPLASDLEKAQPFALVDEVHLNSPAEKGGLFNGDFIVKFGEARRVTDIPNQIVDGEPLTVTVFRVDHSGRTFIDLSITPGPWEGNGLVGAHLLPFSV